MTGFKIGAGHTFHGRHPDGSHLHLVPGDIVPEHVIEAHAANIDRLVDRGVFVQAKEPEAKPARRKKAGT